MRRAGLAFLVSMAALAAPRLEGGPFLPYQINRARVVDDEGLLGSLELVGLRWDGVRVPLFRTHIAARSQSEELRFYVDEELRGLELRVQDRSAAFELSAPGAVGAEEAALRSRMRALDPPAHLSPDAEAPSRFFPMGTDLATAGFQASSALFGLPVSQGPLLLLGGFILIALGASALPPATGPRRALAGGISVCAALGVTFAVVCLGVPRAVLFRVGFPAGQVPSVVERSIVALPGYTRVDYRVPGRAEDVALVGLWAPAGAGVPVAEVVPGGARVRFSSPPLVTGEGRLLAKVFVTGWVVHAGH